MIFECCGPYNFISLLNTGELMNKICICIVAGFVILVLAAAESRISNTGVPAISNSRYKEYAQTVILDAGHGGEDSGAVAADGTLEKDINLTISNMIASYFELFGVKYIPVRTCDTSVCDGQYLTVRERKRSDILNRFALINDTPESVLLSIHQNFFSEPRYYGTQVFYSANNDASKSLAVNIRKTVCEALQPENKREIKPSDNSIYLLYHAKTTSVMVECGFLSNPDELTLLCSESYESELSYFITKGLINFLNE